MWKDWGSASKDDRQKVPLAELGFSAVTSAGLKSVPELDNRVSVLRKQPALTTAIF